MIVHPPGWAQIEAGSWGEVHEGKHAQTGTKSIVSQYWVNSDSRQAAEKFMKVPDLSLRVALAHDLSHLLMICRTCSWFVALVDPSQLSCFYSAELPCFVSLVGPDLQISQVLEDTCNHLEARSNTVVHHRSHYHSVSPTSGSISMSYSGSMM